MSILLKTLLGDLTDSTSPLFNYKSILDGLDINIGDVNLNEGVLDYNGKRYRLCEEGTCCQGDEKECKTSDCPSKGDQCCDGSFIVKLTPEQVESIRYNTTNGDNTDCIGSSVLEALPSCEEVEKAKLANEEQAVLDYRTAKVLKILEDNEEAFETKNYAKSQLVPKFMDADDFENFKL